MHMTYPSFLGLFLLFRLGSSIILPVNVASNSTNSTLSDSLGINCRGSYLCPSDRLAGDYIGLMLNIASGTARCNPGSSFNCGPLNDTDYYAAGAHIVCLPTGQSFLGGICAFAQGNVGAPEHGAGAAGVLGNLVKAKLLELTLHGCRICGSVPLGDNNDPNEAGILTVNYIKGPACPGLCPPTHYYFSDQVIEIA